MLTLSGFAEKMKVRKMKTNIPRSDIRFDGLFSATSTTRKVTRPAAIKTQQQLK